MTAIFIRLLIVLLVVFLIVIWRYNRSLEISLMSKTTRKRKISLRALRNTLIFYRQTSELDLEITPPSSFVLSTTLPTPRKLLNSESFRKLPKCP